MEGTPTAPTPVEGASVESPAPTTNEAAPATPAVDLGLSAEQMQKFKTFIDNSGGFDNAFSKLKADVSTPKNAQPASEAQLNPTSQQQASTQMPGPTTPAMSSNEGLDPRAYAMRQYFDGFANEEQYAPIAKLIRDGSVLKELNSLGIPVVLPNGYYNDERIREYLKIKAQTVPATATETEPNASPAPTVEYYQVEGDKITDMNQAYAVIDQDMKLKAKGQPGHPLVAQAESFIKNKGKNPA